MAATVAAPPRFAVIMPAYNEAGNIVRAITNVREVFPEADVIVINDGSRDDTGSLARAAGAITLELPHNLGIGGAVQTGYTFAAEHKYTLVARLDGDGQHDPHYLLALLGPIMRGEADVVVGSRFVGPTDNQTEEAYRASFSRASGIRFFAWLVSLIIQQPVTDTTSGFQVCTADVTRFLSAHCPTDYPEVEMLAALGRAGYRIREVPVEMRRRKQADRPSRPCDQPTTL